MTCFYIFTWVVIFQGIGRLINHNDEGESRIPIAGKTENIRN